ncbi:MAG: hypothetical protein COW01_00075 [Bdellovibrionales bacterium CG12_big_fil_rev_8_21_14_0_65_38_15]|nr:MAG: hypothetical protein COW79_15820 [Bdellovibrionales bacterium CG22_combo_CG10-13_8_21_14_all_38_13]PIQ57509.1 MAG: hypothetical protein COW01_00075 [Bdellovibrionales bacterium CG12_big_fil_rev_8_21_14_0_65_38_15]PIR28286.1 MAG: hypothetical protein COV38_16575 [Bdellovibrionales bacterium CG11_big_fil_rev_8_21_14_0_20_38_13]
MKMIRRSKKIERLNLTPILDAIFIFIFFLLMSAQFIDIVQIGSDAPAIATISQDKKDKEPPLNLTLDIRKDEIMVTTGLENRVYKKIKIQEQDGKLVLGELIKTLVQIKAKNIDEKSIIIKPNQEFKYQQLVEIMDAVKKLEKTQGVVKGKSKKGNQVQTDTLFDQIIFETVI